ncbi:uncharacterized protein LOC144440334 [Glandiceps talaboti]
MTRFHYFTVVLSMIGVSAVHGDQFNTHTTYYTASGSPLAKLQCPYYQPSERFTRSTLQWVQLNNKPFPADSTHLVENVIGSVPYVVNYRYSLQGFDLVIANVTSTDRGRYYCQWIYRLSDSYDTKRFTMKLEVANNEDTTVALKSNTAVQDKTTSPTSSDQEVVIVVYQFIKTQCCNITVGGAVILVALFVLYRWSFRPRDIGKTKATDN